MTYEFVKGQPTTAWAYNNQVPGPELRVREGDLVRVIFTNNLPEPTTIHWHGVNVPTSMDGVPDISQPPVPPGGDASWGSSFSDRNYIIYAGQIIRGKGVDVLLESLARIRTPFQCFIFGDGDHREFCEKLSQRLGLADRVFFKGFVSADEIAIFYREASVVAVSSVWPEPFGAVGLEAMRFGLPVVAFDAGGIREWLIDGHNGFLVPWMDRAAFAARVEELLGDRELARQMGERDRQLVAKQYAFGEYISGLENLFEQAIEKPALAAMS